MFSHATKSCNYTRKHAYVNGKQQQKLGQCFVLLFFSLSHSIWSVFDASYTRQGLHLAHTKKESFIPFDNNCKSFSACESVCLHFLSMAVDKLSSWNNGARGTAAVAAAYAAVLSNERNNYLASIHFSIWALHLRVWINDFCIRWLLFCRQSTLRNELHLHNLCVVSSNSLCVSTVSF